MFSKAHVALLASAILSANGALAANHRHAQRHQLQVIDERALVPETTTTVTDITWTTVYVEANAPNVPSSTSSSSTISTSVASSSTVSSSALSSSSVIPTTLVTKTAAADADYVAIAAVTPTPTEEPVAAVDTAAPVVTADNILNDVASVAYSVASEVTSAPAAVATAITGSSGSKRGAAYNDPSLVTSLLGADSKIGWAYNWGSASDDLTSDLEYVPMLWGQKMVSYWATNAQAAIDAGAKYLLGANEPDNPAQANMDPATAAAFHITNMEPFAAKATLTAPAVTNSNLAGQSLDWLAQWISACGGACTFSVCPVHWYNTIEAGAEDLFSFLLDAQTTCGSDKSIWLTEFAPNVDNPSADQISAFLETVQDTLDNNATFSFVGRYSYFYVAEGSMISGGALTTYGNTFAFGS